MTYLFYFWPKPLRDRKVRAAKDHGKKFRSRLAASFSGIVPTHVVTLTQVRTSVYLGQTHLGTPLQVPAWVREFSLGSTGDEISSLIIIRGLFVQQKFEYLVALC